MSKLFKRGVSRLFQFTLIDPATDLPWSGEAGNLTLTFCKDTNVGTPGGVASVQEVGTSGTYYVAFSDNSTGTHDWSGLVVHATEGVVWEENWVVNTDGVLSNADVFADAGAAVDASATGGKVTDIFGFVDDRLPDALIDGKISAQVGGVDAAAITETGFADEAMSDRVLASDVDTYQAKVVLVDDDAGGNDRYCVTWFKNAQPLFSGVTDPTIRVRDLGAGTDLIAADTAMDDDAEGDFSYDENTDRIESGKKYQVIVKATIDGETRSWKQPVGRDTTT